MEGRRVLGRAALERTIAMRIVLTESGGVVGVPVDYEVDASGLSAADLSTLEKTVEAATASAQPPPTSAGGVCIRVEGDDGSVKELKLSHAKRPSPEVIELVERLRSSAKIMRIMRRR